MAENEEIDSQFIAENVGFLGEYFENSFSIQASISIVKEYIAEGNQERSTKSENFNSTRNNRNTSLQNSSCRLEVSASNRALISQANPISKNLKDWGLPHEISRKYEQRGIKEMFDWQVTCLSNSKVLLDCCNLVYSAPTSAGKTLVAEILAIKTILERQKKVIIILPFVSIVREKMFYLQDILSTSGIRVEGFMGSQTPPGGLQAVHVAICTIEKANSLINRLLDDGNITELGAVIVDELHLLGDPHRGYVLELLLTKVMYVTSKLDNVQIQIVGMSATLPNLEVLANWLNAELFITQFRPIPLEEYCLVGNKYYDKQGQHQVHRNIQTIKGYEGDSVLKNCLDTLSEGCSVLIFCMTKNRCENLAQTLASSFYKLGCSGSDYGVILREQLKAESILEVLEQLRNCPVGLDQVLKNTISFGVSYHHAGLTFDERDIIEGAFKTGAIRVLVATSTLSSGVNLPARKVIVRTPVFQRQPINILTYKQMIGRAGRMGRDTKGESILICTEAEKKLGFELMMGALDPVKSCIESEDKFMRAVLEMIASQVACFKYDLQLYSKCTLLFNQGANTSSQNYLLDNTLEELKNYELVRIQKEGDEKRYVATPLGKACLSSSVAPNDGLSLFCELQKARQCLVLETDLHLIYLVTPYSVSSQWGDIDWLHLLTLWESLTKAMKRVGELVGVQESFIIRCLRGANKITNAQALNIHKRFYTALALQDLVNEVPLSEVATKFQCARGFLQSLQQGAATFAGMVGAFCHQLGWKNMELLVSQFQDRLHFGIHSELLDLMKLSSLNGSRARTLFDAGFQTITSIASADANDIENALLKSVPFQSEKEREGDDSDDLRKRKKLKSIWVTGSCGMTTKEAADNLISEARKYLQYEIGVTEIKWMKSNGNETTLNATSAKIDEKSRDPAKKTIFKSSNDDQVIKTVENAHAVANLQLQGSPSEKGNKDLEMKNESTATTSTPIINRNVNKEVPVIVESKHLEESMQLKELTCDTFLPKDNNNSKFNTKLEKLSNEHSPSILREEVWDSFCLTENAFNDNSKQRHSDVVFSPDVSILVDDKMINTDNKVSSQNSNYVSMKSTSVKDISLFSSEDDSSLFEDSLSLEGISSKLLDGQHQVSRLQISETTSDYVSIHSNSILNAFKTTIVDGGSDEEDMKLVYEDKTSEDDHETAFRKSEEFDIMGTQNLEKVHVNIKNFFKTPNKRQGENIHVGESCATKKAKYESEVSKSLNGVNGGTISQFTLVNVESRNFTINILNHNLKCYILIKDDIINNLQIFKNCKYLSIYIDIKRRKLSKIIGTNILKKIAVNPVQETNENEEFYIAGFALNTCEDVCAYLDVDSLKDKELKKKIEDCLLKGDSLLLMMNYNKLYLHIRKLLEISMSKPCLVYDVCLVEWILNGHEAGIFNVEALTNRYYKIDLEKTLFKIDNVKKSYKSLNDREKLCFKSWAVRQVMEKQYECLKEQYEEAYEIQNLECQISRILAENEYYGIKVDKNLATNMLLDVKSCQEKLQMKAYSLRGYHFAFNNSNDVAKALGIFKGRKVSTKKSVLTAHNSPLSSIVIYWRKLNTILTKILYPLTEKVHTVIGDRIHPSYSMYTCTGRVTMHDPNLQSIPRTFSIPVKYLHLEEDSMSEDVLEFNCRNIFKAGEGKVLVSADYCQLEMRILTHYCEDEVLMAIMKSDVDVFKSIAASWGGVQESQVDDDLRQKAKQLCYGIIYGMGNRTLSQQLDVSEIEASIFMDTFYRTYPKIKEYTEKVLDICRRKGYVETLMRRRRLIPDINSNVISKKNAAERQAINTTIQGSAADIAKAAMFEIDNCTRDNDDDIKPHLVLQLHDELVYEVPLALADWFIHELKRVMENTVKLNVPLPVKVKSGNAWGSLKEVHFSKKL